MTSTRLADRATAALAVVLLLASVCAWSLLRPPAARAATVPNPDPSLIAQWKPCQPDTGVTVTVDFTSLGDHKIYVGCALGDQDSGADALKNAGFSIAGTKQYGENFICRINKLPGPKNQDCQGTPGALAYWSYWVADHPNGIWGYSGVGAKDSTNHPRKGTFQGWAFSTDDGRTIFPRIAPIDSRGADVHTPAPLPSSAAAAKLATTWLQPVLRNALRPSNAKDYLSPGTAADLIHAAAGLDIGTQNRKTLAAVLRDGAEDTATGGSPDTFDTNQAVGVLAALVDLDDPTDAPMIKRLAGRIRSLMYPAGTANPHGTFIGSDGPDVTFDNGYGGTSYRQGDIIEALLAADGSVPAAAVRWLLSTQAPSGEAVARVCGDDGQSLCAGAGAVYSVKPTVQFIDALRRVEAKGQAALDGNGGDESVRLDDIRAAITRAGQFLTRAQQADGGYVGNYPASPRTAGIATAWTTALAARGLAESGQPAAARRATRWLAALQLTNSTRAPAEVIGDVPADANYFASQAANGLGGDPTTTDDPVVIGYLYPTELPDTLAVLRAWSAAPYRDAAVMSTRVTDLTARSARVQLELRPGSDDQKVQVSYGALNASRRTTKPVTVAAGDDTATTVVSVTGLQPTTTYSYQVTSTGGGTSVTSDVGTFTTARAAGSTGRPDLRAGVAYLTSAKRLIGGTHYQPTGPGYTDFGLTMDTAFALAATNTADPTLARITGYVAAHADTYTGIGTQYASGGSIAKQALLAEVTGYNPRHFGGHNLIAALDKLTCTRADSNGCAAAGNYRGAASVFGQALGVIAQQRAKDSAVARPAAYLRGLQRPSGAFPSVIPGTDSEVDSTAMAAMALDLLPGRANTAAVRDALAWLAKQQLGDGGFPGAAGDSTNSAALAIQGLSLDPTRYRGQIAGAQAFLAARQNSDGGFDIAAGAASGSDVRASAQAVGGSVGTSFATLLDDITAVPSRTTPGAAPTSPGTGTDPSSNDNPNAADSVPAAGPAHTGTDLPALLIPAIVLLVAGSALTFVARRGRPTRSVVEELGGAAPAGGRHRG